MVFKGTRRQRSDTVSRTLCLNEKSSTLSCQCFNSQECFNLENVRRCPAVSDSPCCLQGPICTYVAQTGAIWWSFPEKCKINQCNDTLGQDYQGLGTFFLFFHSEHFLFPALGDIIFFFYNEITCITVVLLSIFNV